MSARIVSKAHIDALVTAALELGTKDDQQANDLGKMLWAENAASIHYRYPDTAENDANYPGPVGFSKAQVDAYHFERTRHLDPVTVMRAIACYEYQTCEHPGWPASEAHSFCVNLRDDLIGKLPGYRAPNVSLG
jgi:hypothetical protein